MYKGTLEDIKGEVGRGYYVNRDAWPQGHSFPANHIFDENQSVKWNREEAQRQNSALVEARKAWNNRQGELSKKMDDNILSALMNDYPLLDERQARDVIQFVEDKGRYDDTAGKIDEIDDIAGLIRSIWR